MGHLDETTSQSAGIDTILADRLLLRDWPVSIRELYRAQTGVRRMREAQFQLVLGLLVTVATLLVDAVVNPAMLKEGAILRVLAVAPLSLAGLATLALGRRAPTMFFTGASLVAFVMVIVHLASHLPADGAARYLMGTALIAAISNLVLPFTPRGIAIVDIGFFVVTVATLAYDGFGAIRDQADLLVILGLALITTWPIAVRLEWMRQRTFLYSQRMLLASEELVEANRMLRELSERDPLTGLPNRRHFERVFVERFARFRGDGSGQVALMMIDLDHFKAFNDRHGHQAGDHCLALVSEVLEARFAANNGAVARFGGEEFIGAVRIGETYEAERLAEDIRAAIAQLPMPGVADGRSLVTTSVGLAIGPKGAALPREDLVEMADTALYAAKRAGRNRVETIEAGDAERLRA